MYQHQRMLNEAREDAANFNTWISKMLSEIEKQVGILYGW
jgi:hypothetical protein